MEGGVIHIPGEFVIIMIKEAQQEIFYDSEINRKNSFGL